jgi:hypothetical protein
MKVSEPTSSYSAIRLIRAAVILPLLAIAGCEDKPASSMATPAPMATLTVAFEPGPKPHRSSGGELSRIDEAMKITDVEFLLRAGSSESEILNEIAGRGLVEQVTAPQANALSTHGASARLVALVQDRQYVLTPVEATEYRARNDRRGQKGAAVRSADPKQRQKEFEERQRKIQAQYTSAVAGAITPPVSR